MQAKRIKLLSAENAQGGSKPEERAGEAGKTALGDSKDPVVVINEAGIILMSNRPLNTLLG